MSSSKDKCHCRTIRTMREYSQFIPLSQTMGCKKQRGRLLVILETTFIVYKNKAED